MCGIGAIVSGIRLSGYPVERETSCKERLQVSKVKSIQSPTIRDIWEALTLRGPDHIGQQTISVGIAEPKNCHNDQRTCKTTAKLRKMTEDLHKCEQCLTTNGVCKLNAELPLDGAVGTSGQAQSGLPHISIEDQNLAAKIQLVGSSLQLRGVHQVSQPLKDSSGNVLVYNGEIFGGLFVGPEENDSEILLSALQKCCTCSCHLCLDSEERCGCIGLTVSSNAHATIPRVLSQLRGPWALIYWQAESQSLWFGRDAFGRRSLLVHWPSDLDPRLVFTSVAPQEIPNLSVTMLPDHSVPHTICSGVNLCDSEKPYSDKVENENTSGDFIFPLDSASNSSNSICKGKKTEAFSHKETMEGIDRGILKHGQAKDQGCLVDANLRCPDSGIYDYWEELPCGIYSVSMHNPSSLKVEHFYECGIGEPRLPSLSVGLTGTVKKYEWQDELLLKLIQWDRRLVEPNKVNLLTSSRADCNINQTCKFGEANELVGIHDAHILTGTSKPRNDASALLGKSLERDSLKSLDPYQTMKNILQNEKELQLKVSLRDNREAARHFQSKDEQTNDAQHSKPGFEHENFSDISIQGEGKTEYYAVQRLQEALKEAVKHRTSNIRRLRQDIVSISKLDGLKSSTFKDWNVPPVAILFSGGLDSMVLAVLADQCLQPDCAIELLNVSFEGSLAPDRRTAIAGIAELQELSPQRRWILVEVDADLHQQELQSSHLLSLICPSKTYMGKLYAASKNTWFKTHFFDRSMNIQWYILPPLSCESNHITRTSNHDLLSAKKSSNEIDTIQNYYKDFNIGTALWFAARGDGWVDSTLHPDWLDMIRSVSFPLENQRLDMDLHETKDNLHPSCPSHGGEQLKRFNYKSEARVLLVGTGADEQCAGYARYRTKFKLGGWVALQEEMKLDMQRIWKRNMGRDDRCIADNGKEARFPFLDEDVVQTLLDLPLWHIADLTEGVGIGDKKILRKVALNLGLKKSSCLPKRAIQFGSRIARESNRRDFGSNRAANRASVGSSLLRDLL